MSRDTITIGPDTTTGDALKLLLEHNIRTLPVVEDGARLLGTVGLRELIGAEGNVGMFLTTAATANPQSQALALSPVLSDGWTHAVVIVDGGVVVGIITQTDLLAATAGLEVRNHNKAAAASTSYDI